MKVKYIQDDFQRYGFSAEPENQDGFPKVSFLYASLAPIWFSGARKALAESISRLMYVSGQLNIGSPLSPLTASIVMKLVPRGEVFFPGELVEFAPKDIKRGQSTLHVKTFAKLEEAANFVASLPEGDKHTFHTGLAIVKNDKVKGYFASPNSRIVASNYWLIEKLESEINQILALAALALMYSEDLLVGRIILHNPPVVESRVLDILAQAFYSVGIVLETENDY